MIPDILYKNGTAYVTDEHQKEAYQHLMDNERAALFLGMSLSKTVTALTYLHDMHYQECAVRKSLIIAPDKVARITWPDELKAWEHLEGFRYSVIEGTAAERDAAMNVDAELYIIGIDNLGWLLDKFIYQRVSRETGIPYGPWLGSLPYDLVGIDELSLFKNRSSVRFDKLRRALRLSNVRYRFGLTGTAMPNGHVDLWSQILLLDDGERLGDTFTEFCRKYFTTRGNGQIVYEFTPHPGAAKEIARKIQDIALSMETRDKVKLPELRVVDHNLTLPPLEQEIYDTLEKEYVLEFMEGEVTVKTPADLTNKLLQVSSGAIYDSVTHEWHTVNTAKLDAMEEILNRYPNETFLCIYQFKHEVDRIRERFPFMRELRKGRKVAEDVKEWNAGKIRLLVIHPASAGHGLNLQFGGSHMIWFTLTWNLEHYLQTVARLLRRGVDKAVYVHRLLCKGTRDYKVKRKLEGKESDQTFFLNEIKELKKKYGKE